MQFFIIAIRFAMLFLKTRFSSRHIPGKTTQLLTLKLAQESHSFQNMYVEVKPM